LEIKRNYTVKGYLETGIEADYIHLYMLIPPKYAVSKAAKIIK
jgi:REP element-mobilizing transposase RayT